MTELIEKLGIDWRLLTSQAVNFLLLLIILRAFAYKPLLKLLKNRREKIEEGVARAEEAESRLEEARGVLREKTKEAEARSLEILKSTEARSKELEAELLAETKKKELAMLAETDRMVLEKERDMQGKIRGEAIALVKEVLVHAVHMKPGDVDETLIREALGKVRKT